MHRRTFLATTAATTAGITVLPYIASAAAHADHVFATPAGDITVHPISHASFVMETPVGTIYVDPVGDPAAYGGLPAADLVLVTHEHGDHFAPETLDALVGDAALITNPAVASAYGRGAPMANGDTTGFGNLGIEAIPAHNLTAERMNFHPKGRDNGYVLSFDGFRVYISGDTEDVPEMRALQDIDLAFVCMNLPFTMDAAAAASAVADFRPTYVYPYHYRGRDGGTQDPAEFAALVGDAAEVRLAPWYG